jgi:hypothetical protein
MAKEEKEQFISLNFRIQSDTVTVDKVNIHQPLSVAVGKALKDHPGRPVEDWIVTFNGTQLDPSKKVQELGLSNGDTLKLTLKDGGGGAK